MKPLLSLWNCQCYPFLTFNTLIFNYPRLLTLYSLGVRLPICSTLPTRFSSYILAFSHSFFHRFPQSVLFLHFLQSIFSFCFWCWVSLFSRRFRLVLSFSLSNNPPIFRRSLLPFVSDIAAWYINFHWAHLGFPIRFTITSLSFLFLTQFCWVTSCWIHIIKGNR